MNGFYFYVSSKIKVLYVKLAGLQYLLSSKSIFRMQVNQVIGSKFKLYYFIQFIQLFLLNTNQ